MPYLLERFLTRLPLVLLGTPKRLCARPFRKHIQVCVVHLSSVRLHPDYKVCCVRDSPNLIELIQYLVASGYGLSVTEVYDENHRLVIPQEVLAN